MWHDFSRQITKNVELNMETETIFWDTRYENENSILGRREYVTFCILGEAI